MISFQKGIIIFFISLFLTSCSSLTQTKPSDPFQGPYPASFGAIRESNPILAREVMKLPEFQDGISSTEGTALEKLCSLYLENTKNFDILFAEMYRTGEHNVRKYCSPLQALFWILERGDSESVSQIMANYSLIRLLDKAWSFSPPAFSENELSEIFEGINDKNLREVYLYDRERHPNERLTKNLLLDYRLSKNRFSIKARRLLRKKESYQSPLWSNFGDVTDRLNSPELINYYEQRRFSYAPWRTIPFYLQNYDSNIPNCARYVFKNNRGDCSYTTGFTIYCLRKAGYPAFEMRVKPGSPKYNYHAVCVFYWNNEKYVMDNGTQIPKGIIQYSAYMRYNTELN